MHCRLQHDLHHNKASFQYVFLELQNRLFVLMSHKNISLTSILLWPVYSMFCDNVDLGMTCYMTVCNSSMYYLVFILYETVFSSLYYVEYDFCVNRA